MAWLALIAFIRLSTHPAILPKPLSVANATSMVEDWLLRPRARLLHPTERHSGILSRLLLVASTAANLTNNAHLAALGLEHGAMVGSFDKDFKRFSGLKLEFFA